jgi:hypothetical protein
MASPSFCFKTANVFNFGIYEKTLCYVKSKLSYARARTFCESNGLQLYKANTKATRDVLKGFTAKTFGASRRAVAYIDGIKNNKCLTYSGTGNLNYEPCKITYTFVCEFNNTG